MNSQSNKDVLLRLTGALNSRNLGAVLKAFPDAHWTVEEVLEDGDRIIGRFTFNGTQTGPFFNLPPGGKKSPIRLSPFTTSRTAG